MKSSDNESDELFIINRFVSDSFAEREYRCLGQWKEGELVYTYTQRKDVGTYECFVGSIVSQTDIKSTSRKLQASTANGMSIL